MADSATGVSPQQTVMGNIGDDEREIQFEPLPESIPRPQENPVPDPEPDLLPT